VELRRRQVLVGAVAIAVAGASSASRAGIAPARSLSFNNLHTGERLTTVYWSDGHHQAKACRDIDWVLRDHRSGDVAAMASPLLDLLYVLGAKLGSDIPFDVISGYRSPATNASMARPGSGVATNSLHTRGMAIDIRVPGCSLTRLRDEAAALKLGGVGYYPKSGFVHVDIGRVRYW